MGHAKGWPGPSDFSNRSGSIINGSSEQVPAIAFPWPKVRDLLNDLPQASGLFYGISCHLFSQVAGDG